MKRFVILLVAVASVLAWTGSGRAGEAIGWLDGKRYEFLLDTQNRMNVRFAVWFAKDDGAIDANLQVYGPEGKRLDAERLTGDRVFYFHRAPAAEKLKIVISGRPAPGQKVGPYFVLFSSHPITEDPVWLEKSQAEERRLRVEHALAAIERKGGEVSVDEKAPGKPVVGISFGHVAGIAYVTDQDLAQLAAFPQLRTLDLTGSDLHDNSLRYLEGLTGLEELDLSLNPWLHNECLKHLRGLTNLRTLKIYATSIGPEGIRELQKALPQLRDVRGP